MKVLWLIDEIAFSEDYDSLVAEVKKTSATVVNPRYYRNSGICRDKDTVLVPYLSVNMISDYKDCIDGHISRFNYNSYYPIFKGYLLNEFPTYLPLNLVEDNWGSLFFYSSKIFIRPVSGNKLFSGQVVDSEELKPFLDFVQRDINDETVWNTEFVTISPYQEFDNEYRFFIVDNKIVTASRYHGDPEKHDEDVKKRVPDSAYEFVEYLIKECEYGTYVLDICSYYHSNRKNYCVVELNSVNCSGLYNCDKKLFVQAMNELSIKLHKDSWGL